VVQERLIFRGQRFAPAQAKPTVGSVDPDRHPAQNHSHDRQALFMTPAVFTPATDLPTLDDVSLLWDRFGMLDHFRDHSRVVGHVALMLTTWLAQVGILLDPRAVEVGALLHDIAKTPCLGTTRRHDREGENILRDLGYPEVAYLIGVHVRLPQPHPIDESFVVYYADKRVMHDRIVDLGQRFSYIAERYGKGDAESLKRIEVARLRAFAAEQELFALLPSHRPEDIQA